MALFELVPGRNRFLAIGLRGADHTAIAVAAKFAAFQPDTVATGFADFGHCAAFGAGIDFGRWAWHVQIAMYLCVEKGGEGGPLTKQSATSAR